MQFSKIAISTAFLAAAFASAAPVTSSKDAATPAEARGVDQDVSAEKRLNPAFMIGNVAGSILPELFGSKEAADEFVAKLQASQNSNSTSGTQVSAEKRLNPAFMIGNVAGSILPELFGSKEAADEFVAKLQASQNSKTTSGIQARGGKTDIGGLIAAGINLLNTLGARDVDEESAQKRLNPAFMIGSVGGSVLSSIFGSKEAADAYLAQIKSSQSQSQPAARDVGPSPEKRLGWAKAGQAAAGAVLGWLQSKEGQEWAASKEGQEFLSKAAATPMQARDVTGDAPEKRLGWAKAGQAAAGAVLGWLQSKEGQEWAASKEGQEFLSKAAAIPIQSRDVAEMEERAGKIGTAAGWGAGINIANAILNVLKPDDQQKRSIVNGNLDLDLLGPFIHPAIKVDA